MTLSCTDPAFWLKVYICLEAAVMVPGLVYVGYLVLTGRRKQLGGGT